MSTSGDHLYRGDPPSAPGYPPSGHPSTGYPPPGYPPPGYPPPFHRPPTNTLAVLALVSAFVFAPAAIVLGIVARKQIRRTREEGDGLALAGIIVGSIITGFFVLLLLLGIIAFAAISRGSGFAP